MRQRTGRERSGIWRWRLFTPYSHTLYLSSPPSTASFAGFDTPLEDPPIPLTSKHYILLKNPSVPAFSANYQNHHLPLLVSSWTSIQPLSPIPVLPILVILQPPLSTSLLTSGHPEIRTHLCPLQRMPLPASRRRHRTTRVAEMSPWRPCRRWQSPQCKPMAVLSPSPGQSEAEVGIFI